jgi:hypothetical protein
MFWLIALPIALGIALSNCITGLLVAVAARPLVAVGRTT